MAHVASHAALDRLARQTHYRHGRWAEWLAVALLMMRGYRILGRRQRTPFGEIDVVARRGGRVAFIEVKLRRTLAEAEASLTPRQAERIGRAAECWMNGHRAFQDHEMGMDLVLVVPWAWPRHLRNAFHASWDSWRRR